MTEVIRHPETGAPLVKWAGGAHGLGCLPRHLSANADRYPPVGATFPDLPQASWTEQDFRPFCVPVMDQGQSSACGPHALVESMGTAFNLSAGEKVLLSPWFGYGQTNGGRDEGTALPDLLKEAETTGLPLDKSVAHGNMFGPYPPAAFTEAGRFKIEAAYDSPTFAALCSAAERRQTSVIGIDIGQNFNPDARGFLPPYQQGPEVLGHAISVQGKVNDRGQWWLLIQNHWRADWGLGGFALLPASYVNPYFGAWTLRVVRLDPQDPSRPPPAQ